MMDLQTIEQALRDGPVDEPIYVPGTHRRGRPLYWQGALVMTITAAALLAGVVIGISLDALRSAGNPPGQVDVAALARELEGDWQSTEITREDLIRTALAMGHDQQTIDTQLRALPAFARVQYEMVFANDHLQIFASFDGAPAASQSGGPYTLQPTGAIHYDDIGCFITATFDVVGDQLTFDPIQTQGCDADESLANAAFFNAVTYSRAS
jgi:hypothetical protein